MDALQPIIAQLGLDQSFYYMFVLMVVLHLLLSNLYLKPFQKLLHARKEKIEQSRKEAGSFSGRADEKFAQYKALLKKTNEAVQSILKKSEEETHREESAIISKAAEKGREMMQSAHQQMEMDKAAALTELSKGVPDLAAKIAEKALGRTVGQR